MYIWGICFFLFLFLLIEEFISKDEMYKKVSGDKHLQLLLKLCEFLLWLVGSDLCIDFVWM
jgi:hypothetical protein